MANFYPFHLFSRFSSSIRTGAGPRGAALALVAVFVLGCSSGGTPPLTATCSDSKPCPDGLVCVIDKGLCALPGPASADLAGSAVVDLARSGSADLAGSGSTDLASSGGTDLASSGGADLALPKPDMAGSSLDLAMPAGDMAVAADLAMPPPSGTRTCPTDHFCWENPLPQPRHLYGMWGTGPNDLWAVGYLGVALHWNGTLWTQVPTGSETTLYAVWGRSASQLWAVGDNGLILSWDGTRFTPQPSGTTQQLRGIWGDATSVWAVGLGGTILKGNGVSWTTVPSGVTNDLYGAWGSGSSDVWAVGSAGIACHFGGTSWTCGNEFGGNMTTITGTARNDVWVLGYTAQAWHWNGTAWASSTRPNPAESVYGSYALAANNVWAVGSSGIGWHYDGTSWTSTTINPSVNDLKSVFATSASNVYAFGLYGNIVRNDGTWKTTSSGFTTSVNAMWGASDHDLWVFTNDNTARHYDGSSWTATFLPGPIFSATGTSGSDIWVGSTLGRVFRYDGTTWTTVITRDTTANIFGIYIAAPDRVVLAGDPTIQFWDGARYTVSLMPATTPRSTWGTGPNDIWVGTTLCTAYHFDGASWALYSVSGGCGAVVGIHGTSSSDIYFIGASSATPFHWDGSKFTGITSIGSPYSKTAVYATPTRVFITSAGGEVITGLGASWSPVANVHSGLTVVTGWGADKAWAGGVSGYLLSYKP